MKDNFDDTDFREVVSDSGETEEHTESEAGDSSDGKEGNSAVDSQDSAESEYEDICYICHRPESKAGKMIKIPNEICICADCMQKTFDSMNHGGFPLGVLFRSGRYEQFREHAKYQYDKSVRFTEYGHEYGAQKPETEKEEIKRRKEGKARAGYQIHSGSPPD